VVVITAGIDHEELGMKRLIATAAAGALLLAVAQPAGAATVTRATSVGVHNSYSQDEFAHLADALDTGADLIEVDVWSNFLGSGDFQVGHDPGNANNCTAATTYPQLRTGSRDQNLAACLRNVRIWHDHNPNHPPVVLKLEFKNGFDDTHGYGPDEFDRLLNSTIGAGAIFGPAQLLGGRATLDEAARAGAWPSRAALTGKFLVLVERGTFEAQNPFDSCDTDLEYADRLMSADAAGALKTAFAFPAINGASASDRRTGDRGGRRAGWFVAFDGDASAYAGYSGGAYLGGKYLVVMTDAYEVAPAIDASAPAVAYARAGVRLLAAKGATVITSDWTDRPVVSYSVGSRHYDSARKRSPFGVPRPVTLS
jgi:hypothetical protein